MPTPPKNLRNFESFVQIVQDLRGPGGCPWDKEQTHKTLTPFAIEETYELVDAIENGTTEEICDELGDVLLQVVLHSQIAREDQKFSISDVIESVSKKMVRRHPHVFADVNAKTTDEVLSNWNKIKKAEKPEASQKTFTYPQKLPALMVSKKIGSQTKRLNFDWENPTQVLEKVEEEFLELKDAIHNMSQKEQTHEIGDLLFSIAQLARHLKIEPETALRETNSRFERRFEKMMELINESKKNLDALDLSEKESFWQKAKSLTD